MQDLNRALKQLREDHLSGAKALTWQSAQILKNFVQSFQANSLSYFIEDLNQLGQEIIAAQPSMASIANLVNTVLKLATENQSNPSIIPPLTQVKASVLAYLQAELEVEDLKQDRINHFLEGLVQNDSVILTHSYSATVFQGLKFLKDRGKTFSVIVPESRPQNEGSLLARDLGQAGIAVTFIVDAAVGAFLPQVHLILVGADSVSEAGIVNKIGTRGIAILAKYYQIPFYVVCTQSKFISKEGSQAVPTTLPKIVEQNPHEIFEGSHPHITIKNLYFDITPLELITGFVTEEPD